MIMKSWTQANYLSLVKKTFFLFENRLMPTKLPIQVIALLEICFNSFSSGDIFGDIHYIIGYMVDCIDAYLDACLDACLDQ